jgi:hypothetical protein
MIVGNGHYVWRRSIDLLAKKNNKTNKRILLRTLGTRLFSKVLSFLTINATLVYIPF